MSNPTISQIQVGSTVYDIQDVRTKNDLNSLIKVIRHKWKGTITAAGMSSYSASTAGAASTSWAFYGTVQTINNYIPVTNSGVYQDHQNALWISAFYLRNMTTENPQFAVWGKKYYAGDLTTTVSTLITYLYYDSIYYEYTDAIDSSSSQNNWTALTS